MIEAARSGDIAYLDFLLVRADRNIVEDALIRMVVRSDGTESKEIDLEPYRPGVFMRLLMWLTGTRRRRRSGIVLGNDISDEAADEMDRHAADAFGLGDADEAEEADAPINMHRGAAADLDRPLAHFSARNRGSEDRDADMEALIAPGHDDHRLSSVADAPRWHLIEYRELVSGMSMMGSALSGELPATDVLYFRISGPEANECHYDFHVYRDHGTERRVLCHSTVPRGPSGHPDPDQAWWEGASDGPVTAYEPAGLYDAATESTLLNNSKIEAILEHNGLSFERLFGPGARQSPVLFSRRPGGVPL